MSKWTVHSSKLGMVTKKSLESVYKFYLGDVNSLKKLDSKDIKEYIKKENRFVYLKQDSFSNVSIMLTDLKLESEFERFYSIHSDWFKELKLNIVIEKQKGNLRTKVDVIDYLQKRINSQIIVSRQNEIKNIDNQKKPF